MTQTNAQALRCLSLDHPSNRMQSHRVMKVKTIFVTLALVAACFAEAPKPQEPSKNPEIQKIDARLAELTVIWKQDTAIINRLTNFKRTPVQQGSQAYNTCMQSSQRIQQAEAEAKTLKERKADLVSHAEATGKTPTYTAPAGGTVRSERESEAARGTDARTNKPIKIEIQKIDDRLAQLTSILKEAKNTQKIQTGEAEVKELKSMRAFWEGVSETTPKINPAEKGAIDETVARMRIAWDKSMNREESHENPEDLALTLFTRYDPRKFIHQTEAATPTMDLLGGTLEIKGKNLKSLTEWIDTKNWLAIVNHYLNENGKPHVKVIDSSNVEYAAGQLSNETFYIYLKTTTPPFSKHIDYVDDPRNPEEECMLPCFYCTETELLKYWEGQLICEGKGHGTGYSSLNGWSAHPDGVGYLHTWVPSDGPLIFVSIPRVLESVANDQILSINQSPMILINNLAEKKNLGEIDDSQYKQLFLKAKEDTLRRFLEWASNY